MVPEVSKKNRATKNVEEQFNGKCLCQFILYKIWQLAHLVIFILMASIAEFFVDLIPWQMNFGC